MRRPECPAYEIGAPCRVTDTRRGAGRYTRAQEDLLGSQRCSLGARRTYQAFSAVKSAARDEIEHEGLPAFLDCYLRYPEGIAMATGTGRLRAALSGTHRRHRRSSPGPRLPGPRRAPPGAGSPSLPVAPLYGTCQARSLSTWPVSVKVRPQASMWSLTKSRHRELRRLESRDRGLSRLGSLRPSSRP